MTEQPEARTASATCPACGLAASRVWFRHGRAVYRRCSDCKTVFAAPGAAPRDLRPQLAAQYLLSAETLQRASSRREALQQTAKILQQYQPAGLLLDIGCSTGDFFQYLSVGNWKLFGVEPAGTTAQFAAERSGAQVYSDLSELNSFSDGTFNIITMLDMVYHLERPMQVFMQARRLLSPNGVLGVEIAGLSYMSMRSRGIVCWIFDGTWCRIYPDSNYLNWFSLVGLARLLSRSGFQVIKIMSLPSQPAQGISGRLFSAYTGLTRNLAGLHPPLMTWVPKVLVLAGPAS